MILSRLLFFFLFFYHCCHGITLPCPIDCSATPNVQAEVDACIASQEVCEITDEAIPRDQFLSVFGYFEIANTTMTFTIVPTGEFVERIDCQAEMSIEPFDGGGLAVVCVRHTFCYIPVDLVIAVQLTGTCVSATFNFPGVQSIIYTGPATILGGNFVTDQLVMPNIEFWNITFDGGGTTDPFFADCMVNSNVTIIGGVFVNWFGEYLLKTEAADFDTTWVLIDVLIQDFARNAVWIEGLDGWEFRNVICSKCAYAAGATCMHFKASWVANGVAIINKVNCYPEEDRLPQRCRYYLDNGGYSRCEQGKVQTFNREATANTNCPQVSTMFFDEVNAAFTPLISEFDKSCRIYVKPTCNFIQVSPVTNSSIVIPFGGGDIVWKCGKNLPCIPGGTLSAIIGPFKLLSFDNNLGDDVITPRAPSLGFSSQVVSDAATIFNQTCDCSNFTSAFDFTNSTLQCVYALDEETVCSSTTPECCLDNLFFPVSPLFDIVFCDQTCCDLTNPSCIFLSKCITQGDGDIVNCTQYTCNFTGSPLQLIDLTNQNSFYTTCQVINVTLLANGTLIGSQWPNTTINDGSDIVYAGLCYGVIDPIAFPNRFFKTCAFFNNPFCQIYDSCVGLVYDLGAGTFGFTSCNRIQCSSPSGQVPNFNSDFSSCVSIINATAVGDLSGAYISLPYLNGTIVLASQSEMLDYLEYIFSFPIVNGTTRTTRDEFFCDPLASALASECQLFGFFHECPCYSTNGTFTIPVQGNNNTNSSLPIDLGGGDPHAFDTFYTCTNGVPTCKCDENDFLNSNLRYDGSTGIHVLNLPKSMGQVLFSDNRVQGYEDGWRQEQTSFEIIVEYSIVIPRRYDVRGVIREIARQDNEFVRGNGNDFRLHNRGSLYEERCQYTSLLNTHCPLFYVEEGEFGCMVDDRATEDTPGFDSTIFDQITRSLEKCSNGSAVLVRANSKSGYYEESLELLSNNQNYLVASLENAVVLGSHTVRTNADNITFMGIHFIHPADNSNPLFAVQKDDQSRLIQLTLVNCVIDGSGCRKCGIVDSNRLERLTVNYSQINDFEFFSIKLDDARRVILAGNVWDNCIGRCVLVKYREFFWVENNALIEVRGGDDLNGASIMSFTARTASACSEDRCLYRNNVQHVNISDVDYQDIGLYISRGQINHTRIYDNVVRKAKNGMVFLKTININGASIVPLMMLNPMNKPSFHQKRELAGNKRNIGTDYVLRGTTGSTSFIGSVLFRFTDDVSVDFDCDGFIPCVYNVPFFPIRCESNRNWGTELGQVVPRMGLDKFHNISLMVEFCGDRTVTLHDGVQKSSFVGYVRSFNGSRLTPDDHIRFYRDAHLIGDDTDACPKMPLFKPGWVGLGHSLQSERLNLTDLACFMPDIPTNDDMFSNGLVDFPSEAFVEGRFASDEQSFIFPDEIIILRCIFDGREIIPARQNHIFDLLVGEIIPKKLFKPGTNLLPPFTDSFLEIYDSSFQNWISFNPDTQPGDFEFVNGEYPFTGGIRTRWINRLNTNTRFLLINTTMMDMDHSALELQYAMLYNLSDSNFYNTSGRAEHNVAGVFLIGNDISELLLPSKKRNNTQLFLDTLSGLYIDRCRGLHTAGMLYPRDGRVGTPGYVQQYRLQSFPNTTEFCIRNTTAFGLAGGLRTDQMNQTTLVNCSTYTQDVFWPDRPRWLRTMCLEGSLYSLSGTRHWLTHGNPAQDTYADGVFCDFACCPLIPPTMCFVIQDPELLNPANPWFGVYVFGSINTAITDCAAINREIVFVGTDDPFGKNFDFKSYTEVINVVVPLISVNGTGGPVRVIGTEGMELREAGHSVDTQGTVQITFEAIPFFHDGTPGVAIWDQQNAGTDANLLRFSGCTFDLDGNNERAIDVIVGDGFAIHDSVFHGDTIADTAVRLTGTGACTESVKVHNNRYHDILGDGLTVLNVLHYSIVNNRMLDVGGKVIAIPWASFAGGICGAPPTPNEYRDNNVETVQTALAAVGRMAAHWLDMNNLARSNFIIQNNKANGMEIGERFQNLNAPMPSDDPSQALRRYSIIDRNIGAQGTWHDLVRGNPAQDAAIDVDPNAEEGRFCDDGCPNMRLAWAILAAIIGATFVLAVVCVLCCYAIRRVGVSMTYVPYLQAMIPTTVGNRHRLAQAGARSTTQAGYARYPGGYGQMHTVPQQSDEFASERLKFKQDAQTTTPPSLVGSEQRHQEATTQQSTDDWQDVVI